MVILFNHLQYYPSGLDIFTGRGLLYASTAEGFFAVSGIVLGIIRGRKLIDAPFKQAATLLLKRSFQLYLTTIILTILYTLIGTFFIGNEGLKYGIFTDWSNIWDLIWKTLALQYSYGWADFLRYYALFLFFAPAALWLLRKGRWYVLAAISLVVWCLFPFSPFPADISQPLSWQVIFYGGLTIGFYWPKLVGYWLKLSAGTQKTISISLVATAAITIAGSFLLVYGHVFPGSLGTTIDSIHHVVEQCFNKDRMPLTRVLLGSVWFWAIFLVIRKNEAAIMKRVAWLLLPLGENSLYAYTIQSFIVFFFHLIILKPGGSGNLIVNLLVSLFALALVSTAVRTKFLMKIIPR